MTESTRFEALEPSRGTCLDFRGLIPSVVSLGSVDFETWALPAWPVDEFFVVQVVLRQCGYESLAFDTPRQLMRAIRFESRGVELTPASKSVFGLGRLMQCMASFQGQPSDVEARFELGG